MNPKHLTKIAEIILVVQLMSPSMPKHGQLKPPPQKRYVYDTTWRTRVLEYCAEAVNISVKPNFIIPTKDLVNLNDCVEKITTEN